MVSTIGLELVPGPDGPTVSGDTLIRTVRLGKPLATQLPQVACTLESVEFRPDGRMRVEGLRAGRPVRGAKLRLPADPERRIHRGGRRCPEPLTK
jgi:hypothetical protein